MMAAFISHVISTESSKILVNSVKSLLVIPNRTVAGIKKKIKKLPKRFVTNAPVFARIDSLKARGFIRNVLPYEPPENASEVLNKHFCEIAGTTDPHHKVDKSIKYKLLCALQKDLGYAVPNSILHKLDDLGSIYVFYTTPVDVTTPYDALKKMELPPNLHVTYEYIRFHPDTDTKFGGISAFPRSSTIISSLKSKKLGYKGHNAGNPWNDI